VRYVIYIYIYIYDVSRLRVNLQYPGYPVCVHTATEDELQTMAYHLIVLS
jgi:hypothetical protein